MTSGSRVRPGDGSDADRRNLAGAAPAPPGIPVSPLPGTVLVRPHDVVFPL